MSTLWFTVRLPADKGGFVGRACTKIGCRRYFKVQAAESPRKLFCPYCGENGTVNQTHTPEQNAYARKVAEEKLRKYAHDEMARMLRKTFGGLQSSKYVKFTYTPGPAYQERRIYPNYREREVHTDLTCPCCTYQFHVDGVFGFCPKCRTENAQIYDTNLAIMRQELAAAKDPKRGLRHAYGDLVSTLEIFCRARLPPVPGEKKRSYQRLADVDEIAVARTGKRIAELLAPEEHFALRTVFQKRHVTVHNGGIVDEKYVREFPGSEALLGKVVELSVEEFEFGAKAVHRLIAAIFAPPNSAFSKIRRSS